MEFKTFYHFSKFSDLTIDDLQFFKDNITPFKPSGFWLSDESRNKGWKNWCLNKALHVQGLQYQYKIIIDMKDIWIIDSLGELKKLLDEYSHKIDKNSYKDVFNLVDWNAVYNDYKGVSFTPYNKIHRWFHLSDGEQFPLYGTLWYDTIDCDSACIWEKSCIIDFGKAEATNIGHEEYCDDN